MLEENIWTEEHAFIVGEKLDETEKLLKAIEDAQLSHQKDEIFFNTTKKLLELYRSLRFDDINEKVLTSLEDPDTYIKKGSAAALDLILSMPEIYNSYSRAVESFVLSSSPVNTGLFVHLVDAGMKALEYTERFSNKLGYYEILKAYYIDEVKDTEQICKELKTNMATFHRKRNEAITALSIIIFGPLGERHPSSDFFSNSLSKKYKLFFETADKIDKVSELMELELKHSDCN